MSLASWVKRMLTGGIVDVPPALQACEACREESCDDEQAGSCSHRRQAELSERQHRVRDARDASPDSEETASSLRPFEIAALSPGILPDDRKRESPRESRGQSKGAHVQVGQQQQMPDEPSAVTKRSS